MTLRALFASFLGLAFLLSSVPALSAQAGSNTKLSCQTKTQVNKVSSLFNSDLDLFMNGNQVELKKDNKTVAKGIAFDHVLSRRNVSARVFLHAGSLIEKLGPKPDKLTLIDGSEIEGKIFAVSPKEICVQRGPQDSVAIPADQVQEINSSRCQDLLLPLVLDPMKKAEAMVAIKARKVDHAVFWEEPRKPDWFKPLLNTLKAAVEEGKAQPLLSFPEDIDGEALATLVVTQLKPKPEEEKKKLPPFDPDVIKEKLPKPPLPFSKYPEELRFWIPRFDAPDLVSYVRPISPYFSTNWNFASTQAFPGLFMLPESVPVVPVNPVRPVGGWTFAPVTTTNSAGFVKFMNNNFDKLDADGNGFIDKHEAAVAVSSGDFKGADGIYVAAVYQGMNMLQGFCNDEYGSENDGVTKGDVKGYDESGSKNKTRRKFSGVISGLAQSFNMATSRDVFTADPPNLTGISQGYLEDCYFLAVVGATVVINPEAVKGMISELGNFPVGERKFQVILPGTGPIIVSEPTDSELGIYSRGTGNGLWMPIIEKAYANWAATNGTDVMPQDALQGGSSNGGGFKAILGGGFTNLDINDLPGVHTGISSGLSTGHPVVFGIGGSGNIHGISKGHLYAVTAYDPNTQMVTVMNPLGEEISSTYTGTVDHGPRHDDGIFTLPLNEALQIFTHVQVSENSVADAVAIVEGMKESSAVAKAPETPKQPGGHNPPPGFFVCYGKASAEETPEDKPKDPSPVPGGHNPPAGFFVCYGKGTDAVPPEQDPPKDPATPGPSGHNPPPGFFVCYGQGTDEEAPEDPPQDPSGTPADTESGSGSGTSSHNPPPGFFVCYGAVPADDSKKDPAPPQEGGHTPPPGFFVCYGQIQDEVKEPPKRDPAPPGFYTPVAYTPEGGWVNIYGLPVGAKVTLKTAKKKEEQKKSPSRKIASTSSVLGPRKMNLEEAEANRNCNVFLSSQSDPLNCTMTITNLSKSDLELTLPAFSCFLSPQPQLNQNMMKGSDPVFSVPAGKTASFEIDTYCVSTKSIKTPPAESMDYKLAPYPDQDTYKLLRNVVLKAMALSKKGSFDHLPLKAELRARKVAQTAIWLHLGKKSDKAIDKLSVDSLKDELLESMDRSKLSSEQLARVETFAKSIYEAAEKTLQEAGK